MEHLFRHEAGKLVSALTALFGIHRLQLAEDVVQEALIRALQTWPYYGIPENPAAWLMQTAKHRALDLLRREKRFQDKRQDIAESLEQWPDEPDAPRFDDEIRDNRLRLIFACCHPLIPQDAQTVLALKTLCGFSVAEIATAFLTTEAAIAKRLTRARQRIQEQGIPFEIPSGEDLSARLDGALQIVYLLFNEGYKASSGESTIREDLCHEAIRLARLLSEHPSGNVPRTHALLALMLLDVARFKAREDDAGNLVRLKEQDRTKWDTKLIGEGLLHLTHAAQGHKLSEYHLQAGIAACHCIAPDYNSTDWANILFHYDRWQEISDSPIVALNRAVAVANVHGPQEGLEAIHAIPNRKQIDSYYLVYAVLGELEAQLGRHQSAAQHFQKALHLAEVKSEQAFLAGRLREYTEYKV